MAFTACGVVWFCLCLLVSSAFSGLIVLFSRKSPGIVDSCESFDCGIDPLGGCRVPFTAHFFLVAVVFVVFDAELLLSLLVIIPPVSQIYWVVWAIFLGLVFYGLVAEFFIQAIDWNE